MTSGPAIPVWIVPDEELLRNGGNIPIQGGPAIPVANIGGSSDPDDLISSDSDNQLELGSDDKLFVPAGGAALPYKIFSAKVTQFLTFAPTVSTVYQSTFSGPPTFSRDEAGNYKASSAEFVSQKTILIPVAGSGGGGAFPTNFNFNVEDNLLNFYVYNLDGIPTDTWEMFMEIRVYP